MFSVGQKVVCVDDSEHNRWLEKEIIAGSVYTVSWCGYSADVRHYRGSIQPSGICVHLVEVNRPPEDDGFIVPFLASRFRPLTERKTSIEIFQRMLTPNKEDEHA